MPIPYSAIISSANFCLLAISKSPSAITFLEENIPDTYRVNSANYPNYVARSFFKRDPFFIARLDPSRYPEWTWSSKTRLFVEARPDVVTEEIRALSRLAVAKCTTIEKIIRDLTAARYKLRSGVDFQETVYMMKRFEASALQASGSYDDDDVAMKYPFVTQYADVAGIPLEQAAADILFKSKLDMEVLLKTEQIRLKYLRQIKEAKTPEELPHIYEAFTRNLYVNALV